MIQLVIAVVIFLFGAAAGVRWHTGQDAIKENARILAEQREILRRTDKIDQASMKLEERRAETEIIYRTIKERVDHVVEKPIYRNICIDDDGLRELSAAISAANPAASQPKSAVSAPIVTK